MDKKTCVYILFSRRNGTLYIGVTSFLKRRTYEHKTKALRQNTMSTSWGILRNMPQ